MKMIYTNQTVKYLFDNLKNGDFLGFYKKLWYYFFARLILVVTGNKLSHVAGVFDVERVNNIITFKVGEQVVTKGKIIREYSILKLSDESYVIDSRFRNKSEDFYLLSNKNILSSLENKKLGKYWSKKEKYSLRELPYTIDWVYKLIGNKTKVYDGNCSTACRQSMVSIGVLDTKFEDKAPNPTEFAKFNYIETITKIKPLKC